MRLIDADALIEFIDLGHLRHPDELAFSELDVVNMLNHAPTAYDVDKVVKQLEVLSDRADYDMSVCEKGMYQYYDGFGDGIDKAIEIVKGGGVDERNDVKTNGNQAKILDVTCGSRTIWFNKNHPAAVYCDIRKEKLTGIWKLERGKSERICDVDPDIQCDFTDLPFQDGSFSLVVFDPPHLRYAGETGWLVKKYGKLDEHWPEMLHDGFQECMRVLKEDGVLIFKWAETDISAQKVWKAIGQKPLFGHHSGKRSGTFWGCYMKGQE